MSSKHTLSGYSIASTTSLPVDDSYLKELFYLHGNTVERMTHLVKYQKVLVLIETRGFQDRSKSEERRTVELDYGSHISPSAETYSQMKYNHRITEEHCHHAALEADSRMSQVIALAKVLKAADMGELNYKVLWKQVYDEEIQKIINAFETEKFDKIQEMLTSPFADASLFALNNFKSDFFDNKQ